MESQRAGEAARLLDAAWARVRYRQPLLASSDREQAQHVVGRVFRPHRLEPALAPTPMAARMNHLGAGLLGLSDLEYGRAVDILPGPLASFYLLQIPLAGSAHIESGRERFESDVTRASLLSPAPDLRMHWRAGNRQLIVRIEAPAMQRFVDCWCGEAAVLLPNFAPQLHLDRHPALVDLLLSLIAVAERQSAARSDAEVRSAPGAELSPISTVQLHYRLMATLLASQPHDACVRLTARGLPVAPRCVRQAEDYLEAHCSEAITPEALAAATGVSVRSLFLGFQRFRGVSPMRWLRELRMHRARQDLLGAGPGVHVTDVALRWGFYHLGRFAQEYREAYGETPAQTLAAAPDFAPARLPS
ncbi:AraC family transcriptional regulator [Piscinibacter sp.]|uniref:AraC family transcriptional regulator n=1 Tax=Piscinibacter sp. TaxID=1903157 RepID=UPI002CA4C280|nr:AraC family transcriptional regulator [Albitalea sp.]HUG24201.1 AraC family transcriptional regulator [Albitalea sp.]